GNDLSQVLGTGAFGTTISFPCSWRERTETRAASPPPQHRSAPSLAASLNVSARIVAYEFDIEGKETAMTTKKMAPPTATASDGMTKLRRQYGCGPVELLGAVNAIYDRHLI